MKLNQYLVSLVKRIHFRPNHPNDLFRRILEWVLFLIALSTFRNFDSFWRSHFKICVRDKWLDNVNHLFAQSFSVKLFDYFYFDNHCLSRYQIERSEIEQKANNNQIGYFCIISHSSQNLSIEAEPLEWISKE